MTAPTYTVPEGYALVPVDVLRLLAASPRVIVVGEVATEPHPGRADLLAAATPPRVPAAMDEADKRPRIDREGDRWEWDGTAEGWTCGGWFRRTLTDLANDYGPLTVRALS